MFNGFKSNSTSTPTVFDRGGDGGDIGERPSGIKILPWAQRALKFIKDLSFQPAKTRSCHALEFANLPEFDMAVEFPAASVERRCGWSNGPISVVVLHRQVPCAWGGDRKRKARWEARALGLFNLAGRIRVMSRNVLTPSPRTAGGTGHCCAPCCAAGVGRGGAQGLINAHKGYTHSYYLSALLKPR